MKSILDPSFRYTTSFNTDLSKTFARVRRDHLKDAEASGQDAAEGLAQRMIHELKDGKCVR